MFKKGLSSKQERILHFIREFGDRKSYPPTIRDIVQGCGISSTSVVEYNLRILEREGYIRRDREVSRGIELQGRRGFGVPLMGAIAAGSPIPVPHEEGWHTPPLEYIEVPALLVKEREGIYALKVKGNSMLDALVADGDIILLRPASSAEEGEMVAVWLKGQGEVTLKRFYQEGDRVRLQPANAQMPPLYFPAEEVEIQGKVVAVLRQLG